MQVKFKLSAVASVVASVALSGCFGGGGGSSNVQPDPTTTPTTAPTSRSGVSNSLSFTAKVAGNNVSGFTGGTSVTDTNASLATTGTVGRGSTNGNVTSATITSTNASLGGGTLTMTPGTNGTTFTNGTGGFDASMPTTSSGREAGIEGKTAMPTTVASGTYTGNVATSYTYMTFGDWYEQQNTGGNIQGVHGSYVYGDATNPANIPASGTATYVGNIRGGYAAADGSEPISTHANMTATADFAGRSLSFATSNSMVFTNNDYSYNSATNKSTVTGDAVAASHLDMNGTLTYAAGSNQFAGTVTDRGGRSGTATGRFYGPAAEEIGGVFSLSAQNQGWQGGRFVGKK